MPVAVRPALHPPREYKTYNPLKTREQLFQTSCSNEAKKCTRIIQSAFSCGDLETINSSGTTIVGNKNGFVRAVQDAYSQHHHLIIRPEDVWFAVLTQFSFYVNANAEELRSYFVAHDGQKEVEVTDIGTIESVDFGKLAVRMTDEMAKHITAQGLREWILPDFTTTTQTDTVIAAVLMMGSMQKYFTYLMSLRCGIPSVTLLGERSDWTNIRKRLNRLVEFGEQSKRFSTLLIPVLDYFVRTFDDSEDPKVIEFWAKICDKTGGGSGPTYLSGWITAFMFWDSEGKVLFNQCQEGSPTPLDLSSMNEPNDPLSRARQLNKQGKRGCDIDGTVYGRIDTNKIPSGYVGVPVTVDDNGTEYKTRMVAGSLGIKATSSGQALDQTDGWTHSNYPSLPTWTPCVGTGNQVVRGLDTLQPVTGWLMYLIDPGVEEGDKMDERAGMRFER